MNPLTTVTRIVTFDAAHQLPLHSGPCSRLHGHTYKLEVSVTGQVGPDGMVIDFGDAKEALQWHVLALLDHTLLNDHIDNPTAERVALHPGQDAECRAECVTNSSLGDAFLICGRHPMIATGKPSPHLRISEVFRSIQGEGPSVGRHAVFVRTAECNLTCRWCDTPYTWHWRRYARDRHSIALEPDAVTHRVASLLHERPDRPTKLIVITGGEPLLQQSPLELLFNQLRSANRHIRIEIETNGTIQPRDRLAALLDRIVVSPKLTSAGGDSAKRLRPTVLEHLVAHPRVVFKFVVEGQDDLVEVNRIVETLNIDADRVWLLPQADTQAMLIDVGTSIAELALAHGFNFSTRLHIALWGNTPVR